MIRDARLGDARRIAEIHVRSWQAAYRSILPAQALENLSVEEREQRWQELLGSQRVNRFALVAEVDGGISGFCTAETPSRAAEAGGGAAEITALYVDPTRWRAGVGSALLSAAISRLNLQGRHEAILWVLPDNRPALAFYQRSGFVLEPGAEKVEERSGQRVVMLRATLDEPIAIAAHDPAWAHRFAEEKALLEKAIGPWVEGGIHHVGSTAVPGLDAKPVIDILAGVPSLEASRGCIPRLGDLGYQYAPYRSEEMHWLCKPHPARRTHHLHLVPAESQRFREELAFRDRLRADSATCAEYVALKHALAQQFDDDREAYTQAKEEFIRRVLAQSG